MREIKFRFWDGTGGNQVMCYMGDDGALYYGSGWRLTLTEAIRESNTTEGYDKPKHLMQATGLKDVDGVEVYEGDIVIDTDEEDDLLVVEYFGDIADYPAFDVTPDLGVDSNGLCYLSIEGRLKVVGNIYENPELLK